MKMGQVRRFAMSLPEVTETPHHNFGSFRVRGKIFVTMPPGDEFVHLFVPEQVREHALAAYSSFVEKLLRGSKVLGVRVTLAQAEAGAVKKMIREAWEHKAPKRLAASVQLAATRSESRCRSECPCRAPSGLPYSCHRGQRRAKVHLKGSCHCGKIKFSVESGEPVPFMRCYCSICRKTAGTGGYAINLGAVTKTMKVTGKQHLRIYRTRLPNEKGSGTHLSTARRYFCTHCGSALWIWDSAWPELVHPHAGAIDTPLPTPPENVHCMAGSRARWVKIEGMLDDPCFNHYPDMSLAQWHENKGLTSLT